MPFYWTLTIVITESALAASQPQHSFASPLLLLMVCFKAVSQTQERNCTAPHHCHLTFLSELLWINHHLHNNNYSISFCTFNTGCKWAPKCIDQSQNFPPNQLFMQKHSQSSSALHTEKVKPQTYKVQHDKNSHRSSIKNHSQMAQTLSPVWPEGSMWDGTAQHSCMAGHKGQCWLHENTENPSSPPRI